MPRESSDRSLRVGRRPGKRLAAVSRTQADPRAARAPRGAVLEVGRMLEALRIAPPEQQKFHRAVRANITSWIPSIAEQEINYWGGTFQNFRAVDDGRSGLVLNPTRNRRVRRVDWRTGEVLADLFALPPNTNVAAVSRDGKWLFPNPLDERSVEIEVWSVESGKLAGRTMSKMREAVFSADGLRLIARPWPVDGTVRVWDWKTGRRLGQLALPNREFEYRTFLRPVADGRIVVVAEGVAQVRNDYDLGPTGAVIEIDNGWIDCLHPDGRTLLVERGGDKKAGKGRLTLFDSTSGKLRSEILLSSDLEAGSFFFNEAGDALLGHTSERGLCLWDFAYERMWYSPILLNIMEPHEGWLSPDGSIMWTGHQKVRFPRLLSRPCQPPSRVIRGRNMSGSGAVAYSPDCSLVAHSASASGGAHGITRLAHPVGRACGHSARALRRPRPEPRVQP